MRREGEERGKSKYNGEIKEGRRSTVYNFAPRKILVDFDFVPLIGDGITRTHDDTHGGQHVLQLGTTYPTHATGDVAEIPAIEASKTTRTVDCHYARVVAGRHVLLAHCDGQRQTRLDATYEYHWRR